MFDYKTLYYFLCYILMFVFGSILIVRFSRLLSYLFFPNDYYTKHFGELEPLIRFTNIGDFFWYLSLYTNPKTAFYTLGSIYFVEALLFLVIILEQKSIRKIGQSKQRLILATLFYAILIISLLMIFIKYMPKF